MNILQVSARDIVGGAAKIAWNLFHSYRARGHRAWLAVGNKESDDPNVLLIPNDAYRCSWVRLWVRLGHALAPFAGRVKGAGLVRRLLTYHIGQTSRWLMVRCGYEDFDSPATWHLLDLPPRRPDILHCHNLHGGYFDLRALTWLGHQVPVVLTLHDAWLLSGHCAHSFECERWKTGCGDCSDLTIAPAIRHDKTDYNWQRKQNIYAKSRLYIATPSRWLMDNVEQSMLVPAIVEARVIPNGVDLSVFHPADRKMVRTALGIPEDARVLLFAAYGIQKNIWRDYETMRAAVVRIAEQLNAQNVVLIALGEEGPLERFGQAEIRFVPYQRNPEVVARYYQAADLYLHAATAETFSSSIIEALACGTPVVATAVGGIPEQVKGLRIAEWRLRNTDLNRFGMDEATGILVPQGDVEGMAERIERLLRDDTLRRRLGENAVRDAHKRFDLNRQVKAYLDWYEVIVEGQA